MTMRRWLFLSVAIASAGCVNGRGCLLMEPLKHTLTGRVHFRSYPGPDGMDSVPILALDRTAYVYSPAHSYQCPSATDVQLVGVAEFPDNVGEGAHVSVSGSLFEAATARQHTGFIMNVTSLEPIKPAP